MRCICEIVRIRNYLIMMYILIMVVFSHERFGLVCFNRGVTVSEVYSVYIIDDKTVLENDQIIL